jgi:hypothetical protein
VRAGLAVTRNIANLAGYRSLHPRRTRDP